MHISHRGTGNWQYEWPPCPGTNRMDCRPLRGLRSIRGQLICQHLTKQAQCTGQNIRWHMSIPRAKGHIHIPIHSSAQMSVCTTCWHKAYVPGSSTLGVTIQLDERLRQVRDTAQDIYILHVILSTAESTKKGLMRYGIKYTPALVIVKYVPILYICQVNMTSTTTYTTSQSTN